MIDFTDFRASGQKSDFFTQEVVVTLKVTPCFRILFGDVVCMMLQFRLFSVRLNSMWEMSWFRDIKQHDDLWFLFLSSHTLKLQCIISGYQSLMSQDFRACGQKSDFFNTGSCGNIDNNLQRYKTVLSFIEIYSMSQILFDGVVCMISKFRLFCFSVRCL